MLYDKRWEDRPVKIPEMKPKKEMRPKDWRQILLRAAEIIEERGWCRGNFADHGNRCTLGAINEAVGLRPSVTNGPLVSGDRLQAELIFQNYVGWPVTAWNDSVAKSKQQVTAMLREVAKCGRTT